MDTSAFKLLLMAVLCFFPYFGRAEVNIFACEPEWGSLAKEVGGEKVEVFFATTGQEDPHYVRAKPSLLSAMRRSDIVLCSGAALEVGWLPLLTERAGKKEVQPGEVGHMMASDYLELLERADVVDRANGDVHPEGNPHVHLNPHNLSRVAEEFAKRLAIIDSQNREYYLGRLGSFRSRWAAAIQRWESAASALKGKQVVVHHRSFAYLISWLGLEELASLEEKPGIPPSLSHLEGLLKLMRIRPAFVIIRAPSDSDEASNWLSEKSGIPAVLLPYTVGGDGSSGDLFSMFERSIQLLNGVLRSNA